MQWLKSLFGKKKNESVVEVESEEEGGVRLPSAWALPVSGEVASLKGLPDPVFAKGMMGAGFVIHTDAPTLCSPINGAVSAVFPGGHAIGLTTDEGVEVLIHIGLDSVNLKGEGFHPHVREGDQVKIGDPLVDIDFALLKQRLSNSEVIVLFPNVEGGEITVSDQELVWQPEVQ
ncbi:PTS glucose transporter subunit IIA [Cardiobacteriaceae bacterium TAE3-ERU3]|nr:PTS glucose transporter subunit IIA [Cardiobacteriaceae bacterium TAE3-ERU3]